MSRSLSRIKKQLYSAYPRCSYCNVKIKSLRHATIDHVIPKSKGGTNHRWNLTLACKRCNSDKGDMSVREFLFNFVGR